MENFRAELNQICKLLNQAGVEYMIIGGLAVNYHGFRRATGDIDIWYNPTRENLNKIIPVIRDGMGFDVTKLEQNYTQVLKDVIRLPFDRYSIELLTVMAGNFTFDEAYKEVEILKIIDSEAPVMSYKYLIANKLTARRPKDLEDVKQLSIRNDKSNPATEKSKPWWRIW